MGQVMVLDVYEDSVGFYIGYEKDGRKIRCSLYYSLEDQAKTELEDDSWRRRMG